MLGCFVKGFVNTDSRLDLDLSLDLFIYFGGFGSRSYVAFRFGQAISLILLVFGMFFGEFCQHIYTEFPVLFVLLLCSSSCL